MRSNSQDREGQLVLVDGELVGVLVRLAVDVHGLERGNWYLEGGFGPFMGRTPRTFACLDEALAWVLDRLMSKVA